MHYFSPGFVSISYKKENKAGINTNLIVLLIMLSGYFFVYIITPIAPLTEHLETSLKRLYLHLLPAAIFTFFLIVSSPEELLGKKE